MHRQPVRVTIVDDHHLVKGMLLRNRSHYQSCSSNPHVILMDINLAPVNGFEATKKNLKTAPDIRIIGVSVNSQPAYARNVLQFRAKGYVTKNSSREEMVKAIHTVMQGQSYICEEVLEK
jgi:DNA-binding NarL/FixJ family response regulator